MKEMLPTEAARTLNISKNTLYKWADSGVLKMKRSGPTNIRVFDADEIHRLAKKLPKERGRAIHILSTNTPRKGNAKARKR